MTIIIWRSTIDELKLKNKLKALLAGIITCGSLIVALKLLVLYIETVFEYANGNMRAFQVGMIASLVAAIISARECNYSIEQLAAIVDLEIQATKNQIPETLETKEDIEKYIELIAKQHSNEQSRLNRAVRNSMRFS